MHQGLQLLQLWCWGALGCLLGCWAGSADGPSLNATHAEKLGTRTGLSVHVLHGYVQAITKATQCRSTLTCGAPITVPAAVPVANAERHCLLPHAQVRYGSCAVFLS